MIYPVTIDSKVMTEVQLRKKKATEMRIFTLVVNDNLVDMVVMHTNLALARAALKTTFLAGD